MDPHYRLDHQTSPYPIMGSGRARGEGNGKGKNTDLTDQTDYGRHTDNRDDDDTGQHDDSRFASYTGSQVGVGSSTSPDEKESGRA